MSYLLAFLIAIEVVVLIFPPAMPLLMVAVLVFIGLELVAGVRGKLE